MEVVGLGGSGNMESMDEGRESLLEGDAVGNKCKRFFFRRRKDGGTVLGRCIQLLCGNVFFLTILCQDVPLAAP